jgi:hypothetical protein
MRVFAISNRGLIVIAVLVAVLWGLIYAERALTVQAQQDYIELLRAPAANPADAESIRSKPTAAPNRAQA